MKERHARRDGERGTMLLVVVFIAAAIAGLAAISSGRVVAATKRRGVMEQETRAFNAAYASIHVAMNVVNTSAYNEQNENLALQGAINGDFGGTIGDAAGGEAAATESGGGGTGLDLYGLTDGLFGGDGGTRDQGEGEAAATNEKAAAAIKKGWIDDPSDPPYGIVEGTDVRVYRGRDYIKRLQRLKGQTVSDVDPAGLSDSYFILEAIGRQGDTVRLVSALVRENQPFSTFVWFQNKATLGVSGAPRGLIHSNDKIDFYFGNGTYQDGVTAVNGFGYKAGADEDNTDIRDGNDQAQEIALEAVDFDRLKSKSGLFVGEDGLDAEVRFYSNGRVRIREYTKPRFEMVTHSEIRTRYTGYHYETRQRWENVQVGTREEDYTVRVRDGWRDETYTHVWWETVGYRTENRTRTNRVQVGTRTVNHTREDPVYEDRTVTRTRTVWKWVPYETEPGGGTAVGGGGGSGGLGEYRWVDEEYETTEQVQVGTTTVRWTTEEPVYENQVEHYTVEVPIRERREEERTRRVRNYRNETRTREVPVYERQLVDYQRRVNDYEDYTYTWEEEEFIPPQRVRTVWKRLEDSGSTIFIDGRITKLYGKLNGRVTVVGNEKVRITGDLQYVDSEGRTAMNNGKDYNEAYERNSEYEGSSVLGVIARDDVLFTRTLSGSAAEINGTLMAVNGRVGIDGFWADETGELHKDSESAREDYLTDEQRESERAYDKTTYKTRTFRKESLRRIGGLISNNRIMETYIKTDRDGNSQVDKGFKRGNMKFDINLLFNPPPNFVEVPRPQLTSFMPVMLVRNNDA